MSFFRVYFKNLDPLMTEEGLGTLLLPLEAECVSHQGHYMVVEFADFKSASDAVQAWNGLF
jgi:hypothetical protein